MSVWGALPVENDDAEDWLNEFLEAPSIIALNEAFDDVLTSNANKYLEITECSVAVLAAAVVAELFGHTGSEPILDEDALALLRSLSNKLASSARISLVRRAVESAKLVLIETERSELFQVMQEDLNMSKLWSHHMNSLIHALQEVQKGLANRKSK